MEMGDLSGLPPHSSRSESENDDQKNSSLPINADNGNDDTQPLMENGNGSDVDDTIFTLELTETVGITGKRTCSPVRGGESRSITVQGESNSSNLQEGQFHDYSQATDASDLSRVKRLRETLDEQQPSVRLVYNSLARESKEKLEELLQQWSQWHAQHCSSAHDSSKVLESGEETYFPALHVGLDKPSAVSFCMDNQPMKRSCKEFNPLDVKSVPLYDRGFTLALASPDNLNERELEMGDASRCFNCGSYSHSLKECTKPRDNTSINNARKQHQSKRNQNAASRNPTRYYQNSPRGKYDGLRPGVLGAETRELLGLKELDPPPWLNRMREIGYPLGYLDPEDEDQPSGIKIFAEGESEEKLGVDGIPETTTNPERPTKMSVEFPGVNAPIPENADEGRWVATKVSLDQPRSHSHSRPKNPSDPINHAHFQEHRLPGHAGYEHGHAPPSPGPLYYGAPSIQSPPGCDHPGFSPSLSYSHRYAGYEHGYTPPSPGPLYYGAPPIHSPYGSLPHSPSPSPRWTSFS